MVRRELEINVGVEVKAENVVETMLSSKEIWKWIETTLTKIMRKRRYGTGTRKKINSYSLVSYCGPNIKAEDRVSCVIVNSILL